MIRAFLFRKFSVDENCLYIESPWNPAPGHRNPAPGTRLPLGRPRKNLFGALTAAVAGNGNAKVEQAHHVLCPGPGNAQAAPAGRKAELGVFLKPVHAHAFPVHFLFDEIHELDKEAVGPFQFQTRVAVFPTRVLIQASGNFDDTAPEVLVTGAVGVNLGANVSGRVHVQPVYRVSPQYAFQIAVLLNHSIKRLFRWVRVLQSYLHLVSRSYLLTYPD